MNDYNGTYDLTDSCNFNTFIKMLLEEQFLQKGEINFESFRYDPVGVIRWRESKHYTLFLNLIDYENDFYNYVKNFPHKCVSEIEEQVRIKIFGVHYKLSLVKMDSFFG